MTRIPVFVIGGYLGAGKTTFINECLNRGLRDAAIIVNDFGEVNIDASIISARHGDTLELSNGCVCCSVGNSLADTLFDILDRPVPPTTIVIEASGVADPGAVAAYTHLHGLVLAGVIVLVDAVNAVSTAGDRLLRATFERQVGSAHLVALTKTDIAAVDAVAATRTLVSGLNPAVSVVDVDTVALSRLVADDASATPPTDHDGLHSPFSSRVHEFDPAPDSAALQEFLAALPASVVRAKGVVAMDDGASVLVQKTGAHVSVTPTTLTPTGLVIITSG